MLNHWSHWMHTRVAIVFLQLFAQKCKVMCKRDTKSYARHINFPITAHTLTKDSHNTGNFMPCSFRMVCGFFNVPHWTFNPFRPVGAHRATYSFTLSNARRFYSSMANPLGVKGLNMEGICETGPTIYRSRPGTLESLTICWFNYKGRTFYSVILTSWVLVRPESNSRPRAWQPDAPSTEPPMLIVLEVFILLRTLVMISKIFHLDKLFLR